MNLNEFKKYLKSLSETEIEKIIIYLYKNDKFAKNYLTALANPEHELIIKDETKKTIKNEFFPSRGEPKLRYSIMKKELNEFKKISTDVNNLIDILLFYVELGVEFTNDYGDIDEQFYLNIENIFYNALQIIYENNLEIKYLKRCDEIIKNSRNIGWGFSDTMIELFLEYFSDYDE